MHAIDVQARLGRIVSAYGVSEEAYRINSAAHYVAHAAASLAETRTDADLERARYALTAALLELKHVRLGG